MFFLWLSASMLVSPLTALIGYPGEQTVFDMSGSPYLIEGDLTISSGSTLFIQPGVEIRFTSGSRITCSGSIIALGTPGAPVTFIRDNENEPWAGILLKDGGSSCFKYSTFSGSSGYAEPIQYQAGLCVLNSDVDLTGCSFESNCNCVKVINGCISITECDFSGYNSGELFIIGNGNGAVIENSDFGNLLDPGQDGYDAIEFVQCWEGDYSVTGCHIWNIYGDGIDSNGSNIVCSDNVIHDIYDKGISLGTCAGGLGMTFLATLTGNIIYSCATGIAVKDGAIAHIDRSTVAFCETGLKLYEKTAGYGGGTAVARNSIFHMNDETASADALSSVSIEYSNAGDGQPYPGTGNICCDPQFANDQEMDFHLQNTSPCIDTGDPSCKDPDDTRADMGALYYPQRYTDLFLNEYQTDNLSTIADDWGEYGTWLEIYNGSSLAVDLSSVFLSSNSEIPDEWQFPPGTSISAGGFLLVWTDGDVWKSGMHTSFNLENGCTELLLSFADVSSGLRPSPMAGDFTLINSVSVEACQADWSMGRLPDGAVSWEVMSIPSPGFSNTCTYDYPIVSYAYPNPSICQPVGITVETLGGWIKVSVFDFSGRSVSVLDDSYFDQGTYNVFWDPDETVPNGIYFITVQQAGHKLVSRKVVVLQ